MRRQDVKWMLPLLAIIATGCTTMGGGFGSMESGASPTTFNWKSADGVSGTMNATMSDGRMQSAFANEAFFDEIAVATNADPVELRLRHLADDARGVEVLQRLARFANWQKQSARKPPGGGSTATGRGMAFVKYENNRTYVGMVATVEVLRATGVITAKHFAVVQDCGQIINPDGVRNQIEGNVVQTVSRTLIEQVHFDRSRVTGIDWQTYPILTFPHVPQVDIDLIDRPDEKPWGAGEPSSAIVSAAISNAVFDAIGVRLRSVPFTPQKTLQAIKS